MVYNVMPVLFSFLLESYLLPLGMYLEGDFTFYPEELVLVFYEFEFIV
jgi:hypothetical protein